MFYLEYPSNAEQILNVECKIESEGHFQYQNKHVKNLGHFGIICWSKSNYFYDSSEFIHFDEGAGTFTLLQGYCWQASSNNKSPLTASRIAALLKGNDVESIRDSINGEYAIIHVSNNRRGISFNDRLGIENIYYSYRNNRLVLVSRQQKVDN